MHIRRIQLVGLAAAVMGVTAGNAQAEDLTITTATTAPVLTSDPVTGGPVAPGNVTINTGGSIAVTAGQTAITVDSNNNVTNGGAITSVDANNSTGIRLTNGFAGTILNTGTINLSETYVLTDTDSDGDFDGAIAIGTNRNGILLDAGTFTGNVTSSGAITIEGQNSAGIRFDGRLGGDGTTTGNLNVTGTIIVAGEHSTGVLIGGGAAGGVAGDVFLRGDINMRGQGSTGALIDGAIDGQLRVRGIWATTGFHSNTPPADVSHLEPLDDLLIGGSALEVHFGVAEGITIEGVGVEDDEDDDGDLITEANGDTDDDLAGSLRTFGSAPSVHIQADASANLVLGATSAPGGFGFFNRGTLQADGVYDNITATGLRIEGNGIRTVTTAAGVANDGLIIATAHEDNAYGMFVGANAIVPTLRNRNGLGGTVFSESADHAYALYIDNNATLGAVVNTGSISAVVRGEIGGATAIFDDSNSLTTITNSGFIGASVLATDPDITDDIFPVATGPEVAIDVSNSTVGVTINQIPDVVFTDDDTVDNDASRRPQILISGDVLFGTGNDTINLGAGVILGDVDFNDGGDAFNVTGGAIYQGIVTHGAGTLDFNVSNGTLGLSAGTSLTINNGIIGDNIGTNDAILAVAVNPLVVTPTLTATSITFGTDAVVNPVVPQGLIEITTPANFLTAASMTGAANVVGLVTGENTPFVYDLNIVAVNPIVDGTANTLAATFTFKSAADLGLNNNEATAFDPIIEALRTDSEASNALLALSNAADFANAYEDLMPSYATGATELAATAIQQMQGATSNRLAATRLHDLHDVSAWAQEIGYALTRTPADANGQEFDGHGFGLAAGIDGPLNSGGLFGLSASFITSETQDAGRPEGEISASFGQLNAYLGTAFGPVDIDLIGGLGAGKMHSRRFVDIGDDFSARTDADWWGYEGHGAVRASLPLSLTPWLIVTPQAALTYVALQEQGYTEEGGGTAIDYDVGDSFSQRLWGDVGLELGGRWNMRNETVVAPRLFVGYRANLIDEAAERDFRFVSGGDSFTLADETLGDGGPLVGIGIDATNGYSTFSLSYEGEFGDQIERHSLNAAIRFRF